MEYSKGYDCLFHVIFPWNLWGFQKEITDEAGKPPTKLVAGGHGKFIEDVFRCSSHGADQPFNSGLMGSNGD